MSNRRKTPGPCGICGTDPATGFANEWDGEVETWFCHGDDDAEPTCYERSQRRDKGTVDLLNRIFGLLP